MTYSLGRAAIELRSSQPAGVEAIARPPFNRWSSCYALLALWLLAVSAGWWCIGAYQFKSEGASTDELASRWPADVPLAPSKLGKTLVLFLHPKCPCSRATLKELERMLVEARGRGRSLPALYVVATVPPGADASWTDTGNMRRAAQMPEATVQLDPGGRLAARFGATTSGAVMLYDQWGRLEYGGGITAGRGMEGENRGSAAVEGLLSGERCQSEVIPAFGCRLCLPRAEQAGSQKTASPAGAVEGQCLLTNAGTTLCETGNPQ